MKALNFNEVRVVVNCQYWENKAFESGGEAWVPKGGISYSFVIESDDWFYDEDRIKPLVERIIFRRCNLYCRMEVVDYEVIFVDPRDISDEVTEAVKGLYDKNPFLVVNKILD
jgi:hypothetical protein